MNYQVTPLDHYDHAIFRDGPSTLGEKDASGVG